MIATLVRLPLEPFLHGRAPYALYYLPILFSAWSLGVGPTLLAIGASLGSAWYLFVPVSEPGYPASLLLFLVVSSAMLLLARAARKTRRAAEHLAAIVESSDDAIIAKNLDGIIESANAGAERLFGYSAAELIGQPVTKLIPDERLDEEKEFLTRLRAGERIEHFETVRLTKDRRRIDVSLTISPIVDATRGIVGASKIVRDISEKKRIARTLEAQSEWFRVTLASIGDGVIACDPNGRVTFMNSVAEILTGYGVAEAIDRPLAEVFRIISERTREPVESPLDKLLRSGQVVGLANHTTLIARNGKELPISDSAAPIRDDAGKILGVVLVFRDITESRRAEIELSVAIAEREQLHDDERAARAEAERANHIKDDFIAMVSHELRTPLNAILSWTQLLSDRPSDADTVKRGLDVIARNTRSQAQLVADLLDMSRIVAGKLKLDLQPIDLASVLQDAVQTVQSAADAKRITLACKLSSMGPTTADPVRVQQCVWNLLSNAIKFTPEQGHVTVSLESVGQHAEITVTDDGVGIRPELLPYVFERFNQGEAITTRHFGGLGLGLHIVKQLMLLQGGSVRAESAGEGKGARFTLSLPLDVAERRARPVRGDPPITEGASLHDIEVLVVEDDPDTREVVARFLTQHGARVRSTSSAREALQTLIGTSPDVLLCDIGLPDVDGYELIQRIRQLHGGKWGAIPAIAFTAYARSEDRTKALRAGYQAHLVKPVELPELLETVSSFAGWAARTRAASTPDA